MDYNRLKSYKFGSSLFQPPTKRRMQTKKVTTKRKKEKSDPLRSRSMSCGFFLQLLASGCKGDDSTIGVPYGHEQFWVNFADRYVDELQNKWTSNDCELFARNCIEYTPFLRVTSRIQMG